MTGCTIVEIINNKTGTLPPVYFKTLHPQLVYNGRSQHRLPTVVYTGRRSICNVKYTRFYSLITGLRIILALVVFPVISCRQTIQNDFAVWKVYGGTEEMIRYSSLSQIDTDNVAQLKIAWTYHSGDADTVHY